MLVENRNPIGTPSIIVLLSRELSKLEGEAQRRGHGFLAHLIGIAAMEAEEVELQYRAKSRQGSDDGHARPVG
jgi:hypothetical protein